MRHRGWLWTTAVSLALCSAIPRGANATPRGPCADALTQAIPERPAGAPGGRAFAQQLRGLSDDERESRIQQALQSGNIPGFLRRLVPVRLQLPNAGSHPTDIVFCAAPDYLAIGSDEDYLLIPMRLGTALLLATRFDLSLPTTRMVDAIYAQAAAHYAPQPLPAGDTMRSTDYYLRHNDMIGAQRSALGIQPGALSAGDKKDLVITNRLWSNLDRVAIYGWHQGNREPIQPLSTVHGWRYADYSHGVRMVSTRVFVNGVPGSLFDLLQRPRMAGALSGEGVMDNLAALIGVLSARARSALANVADVWADSSRSP
jgi:hypothetical protein